MDFRAHISGEKLAVVFEQLRHSKCGRGSKSVVSPFPPTKTFFFIFFPLVPPSRRSKCQFLPVLDSSLKSYTPNHKFGVVRLAARMC